MWCPKSIQMVTMHSSLDILHDAACVGCPHLLSHHSSAVCWHFVWFTAVCISNRRNARMPAFILALSIHGSPLCSWLMLMDACHGLSLKGIGMAKLLSPQASDDASALHQPSVTVAVLPAVPCMTNHWWPAHVHCCCKPWHHRLPQTLLFLLVPQKVGCPL